MAIDPAPTEPIPAAAAQPPSQRVRVGMLGLASVFLLVMLATAILSLGGNDTSTGNAVLTANATEPPHEPLAELGVAPGNPSQDAAPAKTAAR